MLHPTCLENLSSTVAACLSFCVGRHTEEVVLDAPYGDAPPSLTSPLHKDVYKMHEEYDMGRGGPGPDEPDWDGAGGASLDRAGFTNFSDPELGTEDQQLSQDQIDKVVDDAAAAALLQVKGDFSPDGAPASDFNSADISSHDNFTSAPDTRPVAGLPFPDAPPTVNNKGEPAVMP